jgi:hypothetical protein
MKWIDVDSKTTLEDFLTLKKDWTCTASTECNEKIRGNKNELALRQRCRDVSFKKPVRWQWKNELL